METGKDKIYDIFQPRRIGLLFRRDLAASYRTILIASAVVAGLMLLSSLLAGWRHEDGGAHQVFYLQILFIGGYLVSSRAFREIHDPQKAYTCVLLPASPLEKFASRVLATSLIYALGTLIAYLGVAGLYELLNRLLFGFSRRLFNPFSRGMLLTLAAYLITQSLFVLGSAWFRKTAFLKTLLVLFVIFILTGLLAYFSLVLLLPDYFDGLAPVKDLGPHFEYLNSRGWRGGGVARFFRIVAEAARIFFWGLLAPLCWFLGYRRYRRIEV
jgi:hypothetical protein